MALLSVMLVAPALAFVPPAPPHALYARQPVFAAALQQRPALSSAPKSRPLAPPQRSLQQRPVQVLVFRERVKGWPRVRQRGDATRATCCAAWLLRSVAESAEAPYLCSMFLPPTCLFLLERK